MWKEWQLKQAEECLAHLGIRVKLKMSDSSHPGPLSAQPQSQWRSNACTAFALLLASLWIATALAVAGVTVPPKARLSSHNWQMRHVKAGSVNEREGHVQAMRRMQQS
jgi:hypothetical protein